MTTSANVIHYIIRDLNGKQVGTLRQHFLCVMRWGDLLKYTPPENYTIESEYSDEEEEIEYGKPESLKKFIDDLKEDKANFETHEEMYKRISESMKKQFEEKYKDK